MPTVIKVGGSLFDVPDLGERLRSYVEQVHDDAVYLFPGGGPATDVIRRLDACHGLREEAAHWLALRMLTVNAHFIHALLPDFPVQAGVEPCCRAILDPHALAVRDEKQPGSLPHCWDAATDTFAARA